MPVSENVTDHWFTGRHNEACAYRYGKNEFGEWITCSRSREEHAHAIPQDTRPPASYWWKDVECPRCHSPKGRTCVTPDGTAVPYVHGERDEAVEKELPDALI